MTEMAFTPVARILPPEEVAEKAPAFAMLDPEYGFVVVVEDGGPGGQILGRWAAMTVAHVEGLEVIPEAAGHAGVARALLALMVETLVERGVAEVMTQADRPEVETMIESAGGHRLPGSTWVIPLKDRT